MAQIKQALKAAGLVGSFGQAIETGNAVPACMACTYCITGQDGCQSGCTFRTNGGSGC